MDEEIIVSLIMGFWMGAPVGWFLKAAFTWRRDAKRLRSGDPQPAAPPPVAAPQEARIEALMQRVSRRLETVEDRLEFTERILDARAPGVQSQEENRRISEASSDRTDAAGRPG